MNKQTYEKSMAVLEELRKVINEAADTIELKGGSMIEIADTVKHHPSGETWVVARVTDTDIYPAGWPPCRAELSDCELIKKATPEQRSEMIERLKELPSSDSRHISSQ